MEPLDNKQFRSRLKIAIESCGLNASEVARRLSISPQAAHAWLVGTNIPRAKRIQQIAQVLSVSPTWLAYGEGLMDPKAAPVAKPGQKPELAILSRGPAAERALVSSAWEDALKHALPPALRENLGRRMPQPWPRVDYTSSRVVAEIRTVPSTMLMPDRLYRSIIQLLIAGRLAEITGTQRHLLLILADVEALKPPVVPASMMIEAQLLGVEIATVITPSDAAEALKSAESI